MRLENLYKNFGKSSPEEQSAYIAAYRLRRAEDMLKPSTYKKKKTPTATTKVEFSEEEKLLMKLLGLKQKDVLALRSATESTEEETDDTELFKDSTFDEEDGG